MSEDNGHSIFSPSKAHRYLRCPGSIALEEGQPDTGSAFAYEGTAAHMLAEMVLTGAIRTADEMLNETLFWNESHGKESWRVDQDMIDNVTRYVQTVRDRVEEFKMLPGATDVRLEVEYRVGLSDIIGQPGQSGTADIVIVTEFEDDTILLSIEDLKYGRGVEVSAVENEQLMTYAAGVMADYETVGYDVRKVYTVIHQVRLHHLSEAEYTPEDLANFTRTLRAQAAVAQLQRERLAAGTKPGDLVLSPGEKQCRFCKAKAFCPAARDEVAKSVYNGRAPVTPAEFDDLETELPENLAANAGGDESAWLAACLGKVDFIEDWCKAVRAAVFARLSDGLQVPGYKLVEGRKGNRAWSDAQEAEEVLKSMRLKQDDMYTKSLISPTQAEKLLKDTPRRWSRVEQLITRADGKPSVAPETDKRPALDVRPASDDFDDLENGEDLV